MQKYPKRKCLALKDNLRRQIVLKGFPEVAWDMDEISELGLIFSDMWLRELFKYGVMRFSVTVAVL